MAIMSPSQLAIFGAFTGAFSEVTLREATGDRSVTLDRDEKSILSHRYPQGSFTRKGGAVPDGKPSHLPFLVHQRNDVRLSAPSQVDLPITYPKKTGFETRLYMLNSAGFDGKEGDVFCIYMVQGDQLPHVVFVDPDRWTELQSGSTVNVNVVFQSSYIDDDDYAYQQQIESTAAKSPVEYVGMRYARDVNIAYKAIEAGQFKCAVDPNHLTFISAASGLRYIEAHHLIPLSAHAKFASSNLDILENIIPMCPTCHRRVHLEEPSARIGLLLKLLDLRKSALESKGLKVDAATILKIYNLA